MIYVIRCTATGLRKIGKADDPWKRLATLQIGSAPLLVLEAIGEGDEVEEGRLHRVFGATRVHGEWFRVELDQIAEHVRIERTQDWTHISESGLEPSRNRPLDSQPHPRDVAAARGWLAERFDPSGTWYGQTSYALKHVMERETGVYVTNGAFIAAAIGLGFATRRANPGSPNAIFCLRPNNGAR